MLKTIKTPLKRPKMVFSPAAGENFDQNVGPIFELLKLQYPAVSRNGFLKQEYLSNYLEFFDEVFFKHHVLAEIRPFTGSFF